MERKSEIIIITISAQWEVGDAEMKIRKMDQTQLGNKNTSLQKDNYWEHKQRARQANPVGLIEYTNYHSLPNRTSLTETLDQLQGKAKKKASFLIVLKIILRLLVELVFQFSVFVFVKQNAINNKQKWISDRNLTNSAKKKYNEISPDVIQTKVEKFSL